jgi:hypothetical protein
MRSRFGLNLTEYIIRYVLPIVNSYPRIFLPPEVEMSLRAMDVTDTAEAVEKMQVSVVGNPDRWQLLCKASTEDWMKSTKAMQCADGVLVQVSTMQRNPDGSFAIAEALAYVPGAVIQVDRNGGACLA